MASALIMTSIAAGQAETLRLNLGDVIGSERYDRGPVELDTEFQSRRLGFCHQTAIGTRVGQGQGRQRCFFEPISSRKYASHLRAPRYEQADQREKKRKASATRKARRDFSGPKVRPTLC